MCVKCDKFDAHYFCDPKVIFDLLNMLQLSVQHIYIYIHIHVKITKNCVSCSLLVSNKIMTFIKDRLQGNMQQTFIYIYGK